jgi:hypothetical protein
MNNWKNNLTEEQVQSVIKQATEMTVSHIDDCFWNKSLALRDDEKIVFYENSRDNLANLYRLKQKSTIGHNVGYDQLVSLAKQTKE